MDIIDRAEFDRICISGINIEKAIEQSVKSIKKLGNYEDNAEFISRISQQIIINRKDDSWQELLEICDDALVILTDETKIGYIYKTYINYYNHMELSPKVIEYALKYEKLGLKDSDNYEVFQMAAFNFFQTGFYDMAISYILKSLDALNNGSILFKMIAYNNLVYCYSAVGDMDRAIDSYNRFKSILNNEAKHCDERIYNKVFKMCSLFICIKIEEAKGTISDKLLDRYVEYIYDLSEPNEYEILENEDVHLIFIDYMIKAGRLEEAAGACRRIITDSTIIGRKKNIYKRLIYIYRLMGSEVKEKIFFDTVVEFCEVLQNNNEKYNEILHDLVGEQLKFLDMENKYLEMKNLYIIDTLTGCYNRKAFEKQLEFINKKGGCGVVVFLDLDNLKVVNDTYGHNNGDIYIRYFSYLTNNVIDSNSKVYRYGGDEFVIISTMNEEDGYLLIKKLEHAFKTPCKLIAPDVYVTFSYGIAQFGDGVTVDNAIKIADKKMYKNKKEKKKGELKNV